VGRLSRLSAAAAALWLAAGGTAANAEPLVAHTMSAPPGAWSFRFGALKLTVLRDGGFVTPNNGADFGAKAGPAAVGRLLAGAGVATDRISLVVDALLVRMPGHLILLDTGLGPGEHGALPRSLAMAGVSPADITDILITHAHTDHVGGLVDAAGKPAFPKATVWISRAEWAWMQRQDETRALAAAIAGQVRPFEPGRPILPGITPIALYGHTPGHVGYEIVSRGRPMEDIGDTAHSTIVNLAEPDWQGEMDLDQRAGAATRRHELTRLAARHELIFAPHFPFPGVGWVVAEGDGFTWRPIGPQ
jgi:glyoxylase-like metal-dependent hydrolase (beta-lactamase superfamily II)